MAEMALAAKRKVFWPLIYFWQIHTRLSIYCDEYTAICKILFYNDLNINDLDLLSNTR